MKMDQLPKLRVAFAHYWFVTWRGGEKVAKAILEIFPQADVYTLFYDKDRCGAHLHGHSVRSSILDTPLLRARYQKIFPLYPAGVRSLKLQGDYDLIVSSESGPIKGIENPKDVPHLCYIHTPMRYCWGFTADYLDVLPAVARPLASAAFESLRRYDERTVEGVDMYVANSNNVKDRVKRFYGRDASVVYPPIALDLFTASNLVTSKASDRGYYLSLGAITPYKNIDLLVEVFNRSQRRLVIIGDGSEKKRLQSRARQNIFFAGGLHDDELRDYILGAKALLFPGEEDFGMVPLEIMARGIPVLAYGKGGALETVLEDRANPQGGTGMFFDENNVESLEAVLERFERAQDEFDPALIRNHARSFGADHFKRRFSEKVCELL